MDEQYGQLIEPAPVKFSFGAPGWYVLCVLALLVLLFAAWLLYKYYQSNKYRSKAIKQLQVLQQQLVPGNTYNILVYESNMLLKRVAIARYNRRDVAAIRGHDWVQYLNHTTKKPLFDEADAMLLTTRLYQTQYVVSAAEAESFVEKAKRWIKRHKKKIA